jgi:type I restriction enzyme S subunit
MNRLGKKIELLSGQHIEAANTNTTGNGVPYLTGPADFIGKKPVATKYTEFPKVCCDKGDILITVKGSGTGSIAISDTTYCISRQLMAIRCKDINSFFAQYLLELNEKKFNSSAAGLIPGISRTDVLNLRVPQIHLPEQKAIAALLSTWDEAIEKTEWLIQAKEMRFKRLLNDLIYLPTKEGKWKQIRTKSLFKERKEAKRGDLPLLSITNGEGVIPREDTNRKDTSNEDKSKYLRICPGDIGYNTMRMWQGVSALSSLEGIVSPAYTICIPGEKLHPLFVAYLFKMPFMIHRFYRYSQGLTSDTWNLKFPHFSEVKMPLPSIDEQEQIAETLSAARREIDLLKQLADKYKTQKRGLMQKMLTGEWRVKPEIVNRYMEA